MNLQDDQQASNADKTLDHYTSNTAVFASDSRLDTLEVHEQGASSSHSQEPRAPDFRSVPFSRRRAIIVSSVITGVILLFTGGAALLLTRLDSNRGDNASLVVTSDIDLKSSESFGVPKELQGAEESLVVKGDVITRGSLKISNGSEVMVIQAAGLTADRTFSFPDTSGTICVDANNCNFATIAQINQLSARLGQITVPTIPPSSLVNNQNGAVAIQGATNQISVTNGAGTITLSTPQDIAPISSPTFAGLILNGNLSLSGTITLPINCSALVNGGALTTNGSGQIICSDDDGGAGSGNVSTAGGTVGAIPVFTGAQAIGDSIISQALGTATISGNLSVTGAISGASLTLTSALTVPNGGTGTTTFTANGVLLGNGAGAISATSAPANGQILLGNGVVPTFTTVSGDIVFTGAGVTTIQANSVALGVDTTGDYVAGIAVGNGLSVAGSGGEGTSPTISLALQANKGLEVDVNGLSLVDCALNEILKYNGLGQWACALDSNTVSSFGLAGTSGSPETINNGDTVTIAAGNNITTTAGPTDTVTVATVNNPSFTTSVTTPLIQSSGALGISPGGALSIGAAGQTALLQGSTTTITSNGAGNDIVLTSADQIRLSGFDCSAFSNGGVLTTDVSGNLSCANDDGTAVNTITGSGTANRVALFTGAQTIADSWLLQNGSTLEIDNTRNLSLLGGNFNVTGTGTFSGLITANGDLTIQTGDTFTFNGDGFTDLTGTGLVISTGSLQTTLGTSVDLTTEVIGVLPVANGGTGVNGSTATSGQLLIGNGTGFTLATITQGTGITVTNGAGSITVASTLGTSIESAEITDLTVTGADIADDTIALGTKTTGNYQAGTSGGNGIAIGGVAGEGWTAAVGLSNLTADWSQTGAFDIILNNSSSELRILESGLTPSFFGTLDVGDLTADQTYTFPDATGTICLSTGNCAGAGGGVTTPGGTTNRIALFSGSQTIADSWLLQNGSTLQLDNTRNLELVGGNLTLTSGNLSVTGNQSTSGTVTFSALANGFLEVNGSGLVSVGTIDLGTDTTGNYVATITNGNGITGSSASEGGTPTIALGPLTANWVQSGAFDIVYDNAGAEMRILESAGAAFYGTFDVGDLSADEAYTFLQGGTVVTSGNVSSFATTAVTAGGGLTGGGTTGALTLDIGAGNGITVNANDIAVIYGSAANTAVQGNTSITVSAGTNLNGGGSITLGAGGTVTLNVANSPTFSGNVTVQGGTVSLGVASSTTGSLDLFNATSANAGSVRVASLGQATLYTLPETGNANAEVCVKYGSGSTNCAGAGGGVTGAGTNNRVAKYTSTGTTIGDSTISDDGTNVTTSVDIVIQGGDATFGTTSQAGSLVVNDGSSNTATIVIAAHAANRTYTIPDAGANDEFCIKALQNCSGSAGGNAPNNAQYLTLALDGGLTAERTLSFNGTNFSVSDGGANGAYSVNTIQNIATTSSPSFAGITATGSGPSIIASGAPAASATSSLVQVGSAIAGGNSAVDGGTYIGLNAPNTGAGSAADFINLQQNGVSKFLVANTGNVTAGTYNGQTISSTTSFTGTVTVAGLTTLNGGLTVETGDTFTVNGDGFTDLTGNGLQISTSSLTLKVLAAADALSATTSSGSGLEVLSAGLGLLQGCADGEILKWNETSDTWGCAADAGGSGLGDNISVNSTAAADANFIDTTATAGVAGVAFNLNAVPTPDDISIILSDASGTLAGIVTANAQTFGGAKTFNGQIVAGAGVNLGAQTLSGTTAVIDFNNFDVSSAGAVTAVGLNAGSGLIQGTGGITVAGTVTLSSLTNGFLEVNGTGVVSVGTIDLGTDTTGNYVATITAGNGISGSSSTEGGTPTIALSNLTADWLQSGAFDIVLNDSASELKILESGLTPTFYAILDVSDLSADQTFTLSEGGTVVTSGNVASHATTGVTAGSGLTGGGTVGVLTLDIGAGNGVTVNANDITLALQANKGLEVDVNGLSLIDCASGEVLKYNGSNQWACATDAGSGGLGDNITVNSTAATDANFLNTAATGTSTAITWNINTVSNPDDITIAIGNASATEAGAVTTGAQTFAGAKTFSGQIIAGAGIDLAAQTLQGTTAIIDFSNFDVDASGNITTAGDAIINGSDITTSSAASSAALILQPGISTAATGTGAAVTVKGGNQSGTTTSTGGTLTLQGGNATGAAGTRTGGDVSIDAGTGATANGSILIGSNVNGNISIGAALTTGTITIGGTSQTGAISIGTGAGVQNVNLGTGTTRKNVVIGATGTNGSTIIHAMEGGLSLGNDGASNTIQIGNTTGAVGQTINIGNNATALSSSTINLGSTIGGSTTSVLSGTGGININSTGASIINIGTTGSARTVNLGTAATAAQTVRVGSTNTSSSLLLQAGTGGLDIETQGTGTLDIGNNAVAQNINIGNSTGATAVSVLCGTGTCGFGNNAIAHSTLLGSSTGTATTTINAGTGGLNIGNNAVANTIQIGNTTGAVAQTINLGNNGTALSTSTISIGSAIGTSSTTINAGVSGSISIGSSGSTSLIYVGNVAGAASTVQLGSAVGTSTTTLQAGTGGIVLSTLSAADNNNLLCRNSSNKLATCSGSVGADTLQSAYDFDADGSDAVIALSTADDSIIIRNPAVSGSDSTYPLTIDQLNTGAFGGLFINSLGTGYALRVDDASGDTTPFVIDQNGRVGIGTTNPSTPLHVVGNAALLRLEGTTQAYIELYPTGAATRKGYFGFGGASDDYFVANETASGSILFMVDSTEKARLTPGGSLSIGDVTPDGKLRVELSSTSSTGASERGVSVTVSDTGVVASGTDTTYGQQLIVTRTGATAGTINTYGIDIQATGDTGGASTLTGLNVNVSGADTNYAAIFQGGNVGIGTSTPTAARLTVDSTSTAVANFNSSSSGGQVTITSGDGSAANSSSLLIQSRAMLAWINGSYVLLSDNGTSNAIAISTAGTVRQTIQADGRIAIGSNSSSSAALRVTSTGSDYGILINAGTNSSDQAFGINNQSNSLSYFFVRGDGNIGIGDSSPAYKFTVGSGDLFGVQGADGSLIWEGSISDANQTVLTVVNPTADVTYRLADATAGTYDICTTANNCAGVTNNLQSSYNADADGSDAIIALTTADDSLIFRNPAASGTDSGYVLSLDQLNTGNVDALQINNAGTGDLLELQDNSTVVARFADGGHLLANNAATATTGTTEATARTNVTAITLTTDAFSVNDVIFFNNAGQDYYARVTVDNANGTYTVSPAVSYDASITVTKYTIQNIGATDTDYSTQTNRFFQGYFLGGVVTGAGSTTLSDGNLSSTSSLVLQGTGGNVGIGTTGPDSALSVYRAPSDTAGTTALGLSYSSAGEDLWGFRLSATTYDLNLDRNNSGWQTTPALTVQRSSGNIGIGTTTPSALLQVGDCVVGGTGCWQASTTALNHVYLDEANPRISLNRDLISGGQAGIGFGPGGASTFATSGSAIAQPAEDILAFYTSNNTALTERMRIDGSGNVGIGGASSGYKLEVTGTGYYSGSLTVGANSTLNLTGGTAGSRPGSPTEGMVYFDTTTKQLLVYANGKWQADRSTASKIVAASNSSQAVKDAADYVADGTGDQTEINSALTAAAGGKVYLAEGAYVANATITIPNNTTLAGAGRGTLIEFANLAGATDNLIENSDTTTGTGIVIKDLRIDGRRDINISGSQNGIYLNAMGDGTGVSAREGAKIAHVIINNFRDNGLYLNNSDNNSITDISAQFNRLDGIYVSTSNNNVISDSSVQGGVAGGISLVTSSNNTITGNTTQGNGSGGFFVGTSSNNNTISGNTSQGNGNDGFWIDGSTGNTVTGNTSQGNSTNGILLTTSTSNAISGNNVNGNSTTGIVISSASHYNDVSGNNVKTNTNRGIQVTGSNNTTVSANKVHDNGGATTNQGVNLVNADSNTITGNDITDTSCTTNCYAIDISSSASDTNYLADNRFSSPATINDLGAGTVYANQSRAANGGQLTVRTANDTQALQVQTATGVAVLTVDTTNSQSVFRSANNTASIGAELLSGNCSGTNWAGTGSGPYAHSAGSAAALGCTVSGGVTSGATYQVTFTTTGMGVTDTVTPAIGGVSGSVTTGNVTGMSVVITTTATTAPTFTLNNASSTGSITSISYKLITNSNSALVVQYSGGTAALEVRTGAAGVLNTYVGLGSGKSTTSGDSNTALGTNALQSDTTGSSNTAVGASSLFSNTIGGSNVAVGSSALYKNTNGSSNIAVGREALFNNTVGNENVAVGKFALQSNSTGSYNNAFGNSALKNTTTGSFNTASGHQALFSNVSSSQNTAYGYSALYTNTGSFNTATGSNALYLNNTGTNNTANGYNSLYNSTGSNNTAIGDSALYNNYTGSNNTAIGYFAGNYDPNVSAFSTLTNLTNATAIGYGSQVQGSNSLILGGQGANAVSVGIGTTMPTNTLSVSPIQYSTGSAGTGGVSSTTVTGVGTTWTSAMVGSEIVFATGVKATITAVGSTTSLTVTPAVTVANGTSYRIHYSALQVTSSGNIGVGDATPDAQLDIDSTFTTGNIFGIASSTITLGDFINIQNTSAVSSGSDMYFGRHTATYTSTVTNSGSLIELNRDLTTNTGGALTLTGDLARFMSNCTVTAGSCTDSSSVVDVLQSYTAATGEVMNITNAGAGLSLRVNDDGTSTDTTPFVVDASGNVGIGDATPDFKFEIQGTAGSGYLGITSATDGDILSVTSTGVLKVATTASETLTNAKLLVTSAEVTTALRIGTATDGVSFNDGVSNKLRLRGTARNDVTIALKPEFEGAILRGDSTSNTGVMNSGFCSGSSRLNLPSTGNPCAASVEHTYYDWSHSETTAQDYDIIVRYKMPSDFDSGTFDDAGSLSIYGWHTDDTTNKVEVTLYNDLGAVCGTANQDAAGTAVAAWNTLSFAGLSGDADCGNIDAGEYITFVIHLIADQNDTVRLGEIELTYKSTY